MRDLQYIPACGAEPIEMDGPVAFVDVGAGLRGRSWAYTMGYRDLLSTTRPAREVEFAFHADRATADALRRAADADVQAKRPGMLVAQGEWMQRAYIVESGVEYISHDRLGVTLRAVLLDGAWWRLATKEIKPGGAQGGDYAWLDFDVDYAYDYMHEADSTSISPSVLTPSPVRIVFYGPIVDEYPTIVVAGNTYKLDMHVPAGGYATVDGRYKTITLTYADGTTEDAFRYGVRGTGEGGGEYVFEPIPAGRHTVSWSGDFGFDLGWYEEEGEPPWSLS